MIFSSRFEVRWGDDPVPLSQKNLEFRYHNKDGKIINKKDDFIEWNNKIQEKIEYLKKRELNLILFSSFPTFYKDQVNATNPQWFNKLNKRNKISRIFLKNNYSKLDNFFLKLSEKNNNVYYFDIFNVLCQK